VVVVEAVVLEHQLTIAEEAVALVVVVRELQV
jgi:hypothetical protein